MCAYIFLLVENSFRYSNGTGATGLRLSSLCTIVIACVGFSDFKRFNYAQYRLLGGYFGRTVVRKLLIGNCSF